MQLKCFKIVLLLLLLLPISKESFSCHNVSVSESSATDNGDGTFTYVFDFCDGRDGTWGFFFTFGGGGNIVSFTNSVTSPSTGATIFASVPPISGSGDLEYGDWDNTGGTLWSGSTNDCSSITVTFDAPITSVSIGGTQVADPLGPCASTTTNVTSCMPTAATYLVNLTTDFFGGETTISIEQQGTGTEVFSQGPFANSVNTFNFFTCLPTGCYDFVIKDSSEDGICCFFGSGSYSITNASGTVLASGGTFNGPSERKSLSCQVAFSAEVVDFTGKRKGNQVALAWTSISEINNKQFILERSRDGTEFTPFHYESGAGTTQQTIYYKHDVWDANKEFLYFRLKQEDFDGKVSTIKTIKVDRPLERSDPFHIQRVALALQGKAKGSNIQIYSEYRTEVEIHVLGVDGKLVYQRSGVVLHPGGNSMPLSNNYWEPGVYVIRIANSQHEAIEKVSNVTSQ